MAMGGKMYRKCEVCGVRLRHSDSNLFLARFPLDPTRCRLWVKLTGNEDLAYLPIERLNGSKFICGKHFTLRDFNKKRNRLKRNAIPSLNLNTPLSDEILSSFPLPVPTQKGVSAEITEKQNRKRKQEVKNDPPSPKLLHYSELTSCSDSEHDVQESYASTILSPVNVDRVIVYIPHDHLASIHTIGSKPEVVFNARGLMPPVFTPLNEDRTVNYAAIAPYAQWLAKNGIKSVLVGGTTGEHMSLSVADRKKVVDEWVKVAKSTGLHIQVQVGGAPLADVTDLAAYCQSVGVDSLLTLPELYFKPSNVTELVSYVELVAATAPVLPVLYYHIPSMSRVEINMPAFVAAATERIPNFKGIKFTSNDLSEGAQVLRTLKGDQEMFLGADTLLAPAALLGIKSSIGTTFNLFPKLAQDILDAVEKNDVAKARALQEKLSLAIEAHNVEGPWVPIMKAGMEIVTGIKVGPPSLPQRELSAEAKKRIQTKLKGLGLCN